MRVRPVLIPEAPEIKNQILINEGKACFNAGLRIWGPWLTKRIKYHYCKWGNCGSRGVIMQGKRPKVKGSRRLADAGRLLPKSNSPTTMSYTVMELLSFFFGGFFMYSIAHGPRAVPVSLLRGMAP